MGKSTTVVQGSQQSTSTPQPTAEETELNRLQLDREKFLDPQIRETQSSGLSLANQLLQGDPNLPGFLAGTTGISPEVTDQIVQESLRDIAPSFQQSGLLDSGVRASISARTAGDIRRATEEFNIGARQNLLNLALSGQAQVQQPILGFSGQLGGRLAGLRSVSTTGSFNQRTTSPFLTGGDIISGIGTGIGAFGALRCWVAAELFGGWYEVKTILARAYISLKAPKWFRDLYDRFGERFAKFIKDKPRIKALIRPVFEKFAKEGEVILNG